MATAPIIIPGAVTKLAEAVTINLNNTSTAQPLFTVPVGMRAVVLQILIRNTNVALTGTTNGDCTATFAYTTAGAVPVTYISASATDTSSTSGAFKFVAAGQTSAGLPANSGPMVAFVQSIGSASAATAATPVPLALPADTFGVTMSYSVAAPAAGSVAKIDVIGYLEAL